MRRMLVIAVVAIASSTAGPVSAETAGQTTWSLEPSAEGAPDARVSLRHVAEPGEEIADEIALTNFSDGPATFRLYAGDGRVTDDGGFDIDESGDGPGTWVRLADSDEPVEIAVEAQDTVAVLVRVEVPEDALPGDQPFGIVAELVADDATVALDARVGVRGHLRVAGEITPAVTPTIVDIDYHSGWNPFAPGTAEVTYRLENSGNVRLGARSGITHDGPFGLGGGETEDAVREILPGGVEERTVEIAAWPLVRMSAEVDARPVLVGDDVIDAELVPEIASSGSWAVPLPQLGLVLLIAGGAGGTVWLRRRREIAVQRRIDAAVVAAGG